MVPCESAMGLTSHRTARWGTLGEAGVQGGARWGVNRSGGQDCPAVIQEPRPVVRLSG